MIIGYECIVSFWVHIYENNVSLVEIDCENEDAKDNSERKTHLNLMRYIRVMRMKSKGLNTKLAKPKYNKELIIQEVKLLEDVIWYETKTTNDKTVAICCLDV